MSVDFSVPEMGGKRVRVSEFVEVRSDVRVYYCPLTDGGNGFLFTVMEWVSSPITATDRWDDCEVEFIAHGVAYYDGLRHVHMGEQDAAGYLYYPDPTVIAEVFVTLRRLEVEYCTMEDGRTFDDRFGVVKP